MTENELRFHLEEHKLVRGDLLYHFKLINDFIVYAAVASAGIAAWLLTHQGDLASYGVFARKGAAVLPFIVTLLGFLGFLHFNSVIVTLDKYTEKLEAAMAAPGLGWQTFVESASNPIPFGRVARYGIGWSILLGLSLVLAIFL
jgi:hypothetical protein